MHILVRSVLSGWSLAIDAFAVSLCIGAGGAGTRANGFRVGAACGAFQFVMPIMGWTMGVYALNLVSAFDHWLAFGLLAAFGGHMIYKAIEPGGECGTISATNLRSLIGLAFATSVDAFAVGGGFGIAEQPVLPLASAAGAITFALCFAGVRFGRFIG